MNRQHLFNDIEQSLNTFAARIAARGKLNLLDLNFYAETFFRDFLNRLNGWELVNLNAETQNAEAIDLLDRSNKLVVQVSATNSKAKLESSLSKPALANYPGFRFKFVCLTLEGVVLGRTAPRNPHNMAFDPVLDILDIPSLLRQVADLDIYRLQETHGWVQAELGQVGQVGSTPAIDSPGLSVEAMLLRAVAYQKLDPDADWTGLMPHGTVVERRRGVVRKKWTGLLEPVQVYERDMLRKILDHRPRNINATALVEGIGHVIYLRNHEVDEFQGEEWLTMPDFGPDLADWFCLLGPSASGGSPLTKNLFHDPFWLLTLVRQIMLALEPFHRAGFVHCDLKAQNICIANQSDISASSAVHRRGKIDLSGLGVIDVGCALGPPRMRPGDRCRREIPYADYGADRQHFFVGANLVRDYIWPTLLGIGGRGEVEAVCLQRRLTEPAWFDARSSYANRVGAVDALRREKGFDVANSYWAQRLRFAVGLAQSAHVSDHYHWAAALFDLGVWEPLEALDWRVDFHSLGCLVAALLSSAQTLEAWGGRGGMDGARIADSADSQERNAAIQFLRRLPMRLQGYDTWPLAKAEPMPHEELMRQIDYLVPAKRKVLQLHRPYVVSAEIAPGLVPPILRGPLKLEYAAEVGGERTFPPVPQEWVSGHAGGNKVPEASIVSSLIEKGYHPVMITGALGAGKTRFLLSLLRYISTNTDARVTMELGEQLQQGGTGERAWKMVEELYNHDLLKVRLGVSLKRTNFDFGTAIYIPIVLTPNDGRMPVKLAFLESMGPAYHHDLENVKLLGELPDEISSVLKGYPKSLSMIYIAPYKELGSTKNINKEALDINLSLKSPLSLSRVIRSYNANRKNYCAIDKHLWIFSKWDTHPDCNYFDPASNLFNPSMEMFEDAINARFRDPWAQFCNINSGKDQESSKYAMPYCSDLFDETDSLIDLADNERSPLNYFPRMVVNWLYKNATNGEALYDEIKPPWQPNLATLAAHLHGVQVETERPDAPMEPVLRAPSMAVPDLSGVWEGKWLSVQREREHRATIVIPVEHGSTFSVSMTVVYEKSEKRTIVVEILTATVVERSLSLIGVNYTYVQQGASSSYSLDNFNLRLSEDGKTLAGKAVLRHGVRDVSFAKTHSAV